MSEINKNPNDIKRMLERLNLSDGTVGIDLRSIDGIYKCFLLDMNTDELFGPIGSVGMPTTAHGLLPLS